MKLATGERNLRWHLACLALTIACAALAPAPVSAGGKVPVDPEYQPAARVPVGSVPTIDLTAGMLQSGRLQMPAQVAFTCSKLHSHHP